MTRKSGRTYTLVGFLFYLLVAAFTAFGPPKDIGMAIILLSLSGSLFADYRTCNWRRWWQMLTKKGRG